GPGVRIDTHAYAGYSVPPYYDSMIAKLVTHAPTRYWAIRRMQRALDEFVIEGVATTIPFHKELLQHPAFISGEIDTYFVETQMLQKKD
ncbi:MAG: acetyl-CoA carboxylase biotin carboxylase subunit, partial [Bacteroidetes bacterium]|nr:acetyl-CoA carboxylase biotin carboxylase subunit [Bacteroidota bacterium]